MMAVFFTFPEVHAGCGGSSDYPPDAPPKSLSRPGRQALDRATQLACSFENVSPGDFLSRDYEVRLLALEDWDSFLNLCRRVLPSDLASKEITCFIGKMANLEHETLVELHDFSLEKFGPLWRFIRNGDGWRKALDFITRGELEELGKLFIPIKILESFGFKFEVITHGDYCRVQWYVEDLDLAQCEGLLELCKLSFCSEPVPANNFVMFEQYLAELDPKHYKKCKKVLSDECLKRMIEHEGEKMTTGMLLHQFKDTLEKGEVFDDATLVELRKTMFLNTM